MIPIYIPPIGGHQYTRKLRTPYEKPNYDILLLNLFRDLIDNPTERELRFNEEGRESQREEMLHKLTGFLDDRADEIPDEILHAKGNYKVRINWWTRVCGNLSLALSSRLITGDHIRTEVESFLQKFAGQDYWEQGTKRTTQEEIDEANTVLRNVIENLQNST